MFKTVISTHFLTDLFNTACIQRWNDKLRPVELVELDYQAHRMIIAYYLGKFAERRSQVEWTDLIEGGIFDLLKTSVLTDLRWNVKERLEEDKSRKKRVNAYVAKQLEATLSEPSLSLFTRFRSHLDGNGISPLSASILKAAGLHARHWEFRLLEQANPTGYEIDEIRAGLNEGFKNHSDLAGCQQLHDSRRSQKFVDLCGELRYQGRWSHIHVVPRVSVLGHSMFVATLTYLFSLEAGACERMRVNNFFTGLFHDLPESQTRDVRSPLKKAVPGLGKILDEISEELMEKEVLTLLPAKWRDEFKLFSMEGHDHDWAVFDGVRKEVKKKEVFEKYNSDEYNPTCGRLVKAADELSALMEAVQAVANGCGHKELKEVKSENWNEAQVRIGPLDISLLRSKVSALS